MILHEHQVFCHRLLEKLAENMLGYHMPPVDTLPVDMLLVDTLPADMLLVDTPPANILQLNT
jgi:hypothetical protein